MTDDRPEYERIENLKAVFQEIVDPDGTKIQTPRLDIGDQITIRRGCRVPDTDIKLFSISRICLHPGINVLAGANGTGKSTTCRIIEDQLSPYTKDIRVLDFDGRHRKNRQKDIWEHLESRCRSEGQDFFKESLEWILREVKHALAHDPKEMAHMMILDGIDSGLSIDMLDDLHRFLRTFSERHPDLYIVIAANAFELVQDERAIDVISGSVKRFVNYNSYKNFIRRSRERSEKLRRN